MNRTSIAAATILAALALLLHGQKAAAQLCHQYFGEKYVENFNTLPTSGSNNTSAAVPSGWAFNESGGNLTFTAENGTSPTPDTYSYGSTGSPDRAFGEITSASVASFIGACFTNNTGAPIASFEIGCTGEQWRNSVQNGAVDRLDFQYSMDAAATLVTGMYINVNALDFTSPNKAVAAGALDGNLAANRTVFAPVKITPAGGWASGATMYVRWVPSNVAGANDGLAIDDFSFAANICSLDVDGNGDIDPLTDGLIIVAQCSA